MATAQSQTSCNCATNENGLTETDTTFVLKGGKALICGKRYAHTKTLSYDELSIVFCNTQTEIHFQSYIFRYRLRKIQDTLLVDYLTNFPTDKHFETKLTRILTEKIYLKAGIPATRDVWNTHLYTPAQVATVLEEYKNAGAGLNDSKMLIAVKLFIATISGSKQAHLYFNDFRKKYILDGAIAEDYDELESMLTMWKDK